MRLVQGQNGNSEHTFELDPFAQPVVQESAPVLAVQTVDALMVRTEKRAPQPQKQADDVFTLLARRIQELRAEVKRLQVAEADLSLLEKMSAAAGITVAEQT